MYCTERVKKNILCSNMKCIRRFKSYFRYGTNNLVATQRYEFTSEQLEELKLKVDINEKSNRNNPDFR